MANAEAPIVRDIAPEDVELLRPILEGAIRDSETGQVMAQEVEDSLAAMAASANGDKTRLYAVAQSAGGTLLGVMGITDASETLASASSSVPQGNAAELINAFVDPAARGMGAGKQLARYLEARAVSAGYDDLLVTSGPRYRETGWPFWQSLYGEPVFIAQNAFGIGRDAPVWRKPLAK